MPTNIALRQTADLTTTTFMQAITAAAAFADANQAQVDRICQAVADACATSAKSLAFVAWEETRSGNAAHKAIQNFAASQTLWTRLKPVASVGTVAEDKAAGTTQLATPLGVIAITIGACVPVASIMAATLMALKTKNAVVFNLPNAAAQSALATCKIIQAAIKRTGAPARLIQTLPANAALTKGVAAYLDLAHAPLIPAYIAEDADLDAAVSAVMLSQTYDNDLMPNAEDDLIVDRRVYHAVCERLTQHGTYCLSSEETTQLAQALIDPQTNAIKPGFAGQSVANIAQAAKLTVPENTKLLVAKLDGIGTTFPLSGVKPCLVLGLYVANDLAQAASLTNALLPQAKGATRAHVFTQSTAVAANLAAAINAKRVLVNTPASLSDPMFDLTDFMHQTTITTPTQRTDAAVGHLRDLLHTH